MTRPTLRETKQQQTKQAIFGAAIRLFAEQGFDSTTVEEIVARAGVSRATYFNYFKTKDGVLRYFGERLAVKLLAVSAEGLPGETALSRLQRLVCTWAEYSSAHKDEARIVQMYSAREPEYATRPTPARQQLLGLFIQIVQQGQATGEFRGDVPGAHLALHFVSIFYNAIGMHVMTDEKLAPLMESAWNVALGGICRGNG